MPPPLQYLYIYENVVNGKVYIGTTNDMSYRDKQHSRGVDKKSMPIDRAMLKYGRDKFRLDVVLSAESVAEIQQEEIYWIARMREALGRENVYNVSNGGYSGLSGREPWNKGKKAPYSKETLEKMSESQSKRKWSINQHKLMKQKMTGKPGTIGCTGMSFPTKGKTWKLIDGKRVWLDRSDKVEN